MMKQIFLSLVVLLTTYTAMAQIKTDQGSVTFKIKNAGMGVDGKFSAPICIINFDPSNLSKSKFSGVVVATSINTDNSGRDNHLRKPEYFDVAKYPTIKIESVSFSESGKGQYKAVCNLTIKDVTKSLTIPFTYSEASGSIAMEGSFVINRRDFGVGGKSIILSDNANVKIKISGKK
jgi:polyisoprenoid-binding protein YceI